MRFIPARAGNTRCVRVRALRRRAHPHSRREYLGSSGLGFGWSGSLPLVRGTCPPAYFWFCVRRLIPARAGNMTWFSRRPKVCPAHPRSRGEHSAAGASLLMRSGSSPLARGTSAEGEEPSIASRLIPARAGNMPLPVFLMAWLAAHPRSRGEHESPSTWIRVSLRLIPARAGNMFWFSGRAGGYPAHPRSRGEHFEYSAPDDCDIGSSPLARGTSLLRQLQDLLERLIPARAGNIGKQNR